MDEQAARIARRLATSFRDPEQAWDARAVAALLNDPQVSAIEMPGATALLRRVLDEAEVLTIAVDPGARRGGLGTALIAEAVAGFRELGVRTLHLEVSAANAPARAFYSALGFRETGRRKGYYRTECGREDAILMSRTLVDD